MMHHNKILLLGLLLLTSVGCTIVVHESADVPLTYTAPPVAIGAPVPPYGGGDAYWLTACEPPSCYERWVSGGGAGVHVGGRVVGTRGVALTRSGRTIRNGKIVPIR